MTFKFLPAEKQPTKHVVNEVSNNQRRAARFMVDTISIPDGTPADCVQEFDQLKQIGVMCGKGRANAIRRRMITSDRSASQTRFFEMSEREELSQDRQQRGFAAVLEFVGDDVANQ